MQITVLERPGPIPEREFKTELEHELIDLKGSLSAAAKVTRFTGKGFAQISVLGDDSEILGELIIRKFGAAITTQTEMTTGPHMGIVNRFDSNFLEIDLGIETPEPRNIRIPARHLRAQLADGKPIPVRAICEEYCLVPETRVGIRVGQLPENEIQEAWLADSQIRTISEWMTIQLDRVKVIGVTRGTLNNTLQKAGLERDIIAVEQETLATHILTCKLGTDAIGLIPKLGRHLRKARLKTFLPRRIAERCREW